jgi:hypothetical protein
VSFHITISKFTSEPVDWIRYLLYTAKLASKDAVRSQGQKRAYHGGISVRTRDLPQHALIFTIICIPRVTFILNKPPRGLGELLSTTFASEGANVAINYFNRIEPAQKVQKTCQEHGVKAVIIKAVGFSHHMGGLVKG